MGAPAMNWRAVTSPAADTESLHDGLGAQSRPVASTDVPSIRRCHPADTFPSARNNAVRDAFSA
jgi:hypothetical protein